MGRDFSPRGCAGEVASREACSFPRMVIQMNNRVVSLLAAVGLLMYAPLPSHAGALGDVASLFGSATATVIDIPEGILVDSLYRSPKNAWKALAGHFGDENGFQQNVAGALIGIPVGFVWGIPAGALRGAKHGMGTGWEKPFSTESYIVGLEEK